MTVRHMPAYGLPCPQLPECCLSHGRDEAISGDVACAHFEVDRARRLRVGRRGQVSQRTKGLSSTLVAPTGEGLHPTGPADRPAL